MINCHLLEKGEKVVMPAGQVIFKSGDPLSPFGYYLHQGVAALVDTLENGTERVLRYHKPGSFLGHFMIYRQARELQDTVTKTECVLYKIANEDFIAYIYAYPQVLIDQIIEVGNLNRHLYRRYASISQNRTANLICAIVQENAYLENGVMRVHSYLTYAEIARFLGIHPVTVAKVMKKLQNEGVIKRKGRHTEVCDMEALEAYCDGKELKY